MLAKLCLPSRLPPIISTDSDITVPKIQPDTWSRFPLDGFVVVSDILGFLISFCAMH